MFWAMTTVRLAAMVVTDTLNRASGLRLDRPFMWPERKSFPNKPGLFGITTK